MGWPSVSFTALKWSRSRHSTAKPWPRTSRSRLCSSCSRNSTRLARPVSASCRARCVIFSSCRLRSVTSSCSDTQPPPRRGCRVTLMVRPPAKSICIEADLALPPIAPSRTSEWRAPLRVRCSHSAQCTVPGLDQLARKVVHVGVAAIAHEQPFAAVEHGKPERHVIDRSVKLQVEPLEIRLLAQQLDRLGLEHRHRARELAELVPRVHALDVDGGVVAGEPDQRGRNRLEARAHAAQEEKPERSGEEADQRNSGRDRSDERTGLLRQRTERALGGAQARVALREDLQREAVGGGGIAGSGRTRLIRLAVARKVEHRGTVRAEQGKARRQLFRAVRRNAVDHAEDGIPRIAIDLLLLRVTARQRRGRHQPAVLLEQHLQPPGKRDVYQALGSEAADRSLRLAGELHGCKRQRTHARQEKPEGAIKLCGEAGGRKPQSSEHGMECLERTARGQPAPLFLGSRALTSPCPRPTDLMQSEPLRMNDRHRHHLPVLAIEDHGSCFGSESRFCSSSMEMLSGERMKAMRPSRGGLLIVTPDFISRSQVS